MFLNYCNEKTDLCRTNILLRTFQNLRSNDFERNAMSSSAKKFSYDENGPKNIDPVYMSSDESEWTPCSYTKRYVTGNKRVSYDAISKFWLCMLITPQHLVINHFIDPRWTYRQIFWTHTTCERRHIKKTSQGTDPMVVCWQLPWIPDSWGSPPFSTQQTSIYNDSMIFWIRRPQSHITPFPTFQKLLWISKV